MIRAALKTKQAEVIGDGKGVWDHVHVEDLALRSWRGTRGSWGVERRVFISVRMDSILGGRWRRGWRMRFVHRVLGKSFSVEDLELRSDLGLMRPLLDALTLDTARYLRRAVAD